MRVDGEGWVGPPQDFKAFHHGFVRGQGTPTQGCDGAFFSLLSQGHIQEPAGFKIGCRGDIQQTALPAVTHAADAGDVPGQPIFMVIDAQRAIFLGDDEPPVR